MTVLESIVVLTLILALTYTAFFRVSNYYGDREDVYFKGAEDLRWGIDIRGGVEAVFTPSASKGVEISDEDIAKFFDSVQTPDTITPKTPSM